MIWRRIESNKTLGCFNREGEYPNHWQFEGYVIDKNQLDKTPYYDKPLYEPFESIDEFKYIFTVKETKVLNRELRYAFDTTADAIDFVAEFLPLTMDGKLEITTMIIGERNFVYHDPHHNLTINFKINNPQP